MCYLQWSILKLHDHKMHAGYQLKTQIQAKPSYILHNTSQQTLQLNRQLYLKITFL